MDQRLADLLVKERRRQRIVVGTLALSVALVILSSRSDRAMFGIDAMLPGVFATLGEQPAGGIPGVSLGDRDASAFFARLGRLGEDAPEPGNGRNIIPAASLEQIGPVARDLMFHGNTPDIFQPGGLLPFGEGSRLPGPSPDVNPPQPLPEGGYFVSGPGTPTGGGGGGGGNPGDPGDPNNPPDIGNPDTPDTPITGTPVPEPQSWALMILGFLGIGGMMRALKARRRIDAATAGTIA